MTSMTTYKYRLYPSIVQVKRLEAVLVSCQNWYNMCFEERNVTWKFEKKSISGCDQNKLSALARKAKGGKNRQQALSRLQKIHAHLANQRKDFLNEVACYYILTNDLIALETLSIRNIVRNRKLAKSILDQGWGYLKQRLINPAYTSQECSACGELFDTLTLADRWADCKHCGLSLARDHNAAINILKRATGQDVSVGHNVAPLPLGPASLQVQACPRSPRF